MLRIAKWGIIGIASLILIIFSLVNRAPVTFSLFPLPFEIDIPLFILLYLTLGLGLLLGELLGALHHRKANKELKTLRQRVKAMESEALLKTMEVSPEERMIP